MLAEKIEEKKKNVLKRVDTLMFMLAALCFTSTGMMLSVYGTFASLVFIVSYLCIAARIYIVSGRELDSCVYYDYIQNIERKRTQEFTVKKLKELSWKA